MQVLRESPPTSDRLMAYAFGIIFVAAILVIAIFIPEPTPFSYTVFRIVLALAAAGVGAVIPGFLEVSFRNVLRASGAVALFVIVYFFSPVALGEVTKQLPPPPTASAKPVALAWLAMVDAGDYAAAHSAMSASFKDRYPAADMEELVSAERRALGPVVSRRYASAQNTQSPPGAAPGHYQGYGFRTRFRNEPRPIYEAVWLEANGQEWRVNGFFTYVKNEAGQLIPYEVPD